MDFIDRSKLLQQIVPVLLTGVILVGLIFILHWFIAVIDAFHFGENIVLQARWVDIIVGLTIYLKTSIDFAIFMGRLMASNPGWRNRIALEIGTALGNALGTFVVIGIWIVFKEVDLLLALMVFLAALVLFELAHGGLEHIEHWQSSMNIKRPLYLLLHYFLESLLQLIDPIFKRILPDLAAKMQGKEKLSWRQLFTFSMSIPFILGLDDFAGYVPLFSIINVYGFAIGVFTGHTLLNVALFLSPSRTIVAVKNEYVSFLGTLAFIGLAFYGLFEVVRILFPIFL